MRVARKISGPHSARELVLIAGPLQACVNDALQAAGQPVYLKRYKDVPTVAVQYDDPFWVVISNVAEQADESERIAVEALDRDGQHVLAAALRP